MAAPATKPMTAAEIAAAVGGALSGDPSVTVTAVAPLDRATGGDLSFLAHGKYAGAFETSDAGIVLVTPELAASAGRCNARVVVAKPLDALVALLPRFYAVPVFVPGVHPTAVVSTKATLGRDIRIDAYAVIGDGATLGDRAWIGAHAVIGDGVAIGADTRVYPHVTAYAGTCVGERAIIHAGVRLGSDGFGYIFRDGAHEKIPHVGRCLIGNDVEVGANCAIDRGSIDDTVIGDGTKIDNLVHVAHNVRIGRLCLLMAHVGIAGSVRIGDGVILAGQSGVSGHNTIGKGAIVAAGAGVYGNIPAGETWSGFPARPHREALRAQAAFLKLADFMKHVEKVLAGLGK